MQISLSDVAAKAGVSAATVSRVLNGKEQGRIPEATRERVRQVALELNYYPNRTARSLQSRRTMNIGVLVNGLRNPFFAELLDTLEEMIVDAGYDALPDTGHRVSGPEGNGHVGWSVDGILMWTVADMQVDTAHRPPSSNIPVVYIGHERFDDSDFVAQDSGRGARLALEHLWDRGHRRIALASPIAVEPTRFESRRLAYDSFCSERAIHPEYFDVASSLDGDERRHHVI